jgi:hypothetical protein
MKPIWNRESPAFAELVTIHVLRFTNKQSGSTPMQTETISQKFAPFVLKLSYEELTSQQGMLLKIFFLDWLRHSY